MADKENKGRRALKQPSDEVMAWVWTGIAAACAVWFLYGAVRYRYPSTETLGCMMCALVLRRLALAHIGSGR